MAAYITLVTPNYNTTFQTYAHITETLPVCVTQTTQFSIRQHCPLVYVELRVHFSSIHAFYLSSLHPLLPYSTFIQAIHLVKISPTCISIHPLAMYLTHSHVFWSTINNFDFFTSKNVNSFISQDSWNNLIRYYYVNRFAPISNMQKYETFH